MTQLPQMLDCLLDSRSIVEVDAGNGDAESGRPKVTAGNPSSTSSGAGSRPGAGR